MQGVASCSIPLVKRAPGAPAASAPHTCAAPAWDQQPAQTVLPVKTHQDGSNPQLSPNYLPKSCSKLSLFQLVLHCYCKKPTCFKRLIKQNTSDLSSSSYNKWLPVKSASPVMPYNWLPAGAGEARADTCGWPLRLLVSLPAFSPKPSMSCLSLWSHWPLGPQPFAICLCHTPKGAVLIFD